MCIRDSVTPMYEDGKVNYDKLEELLEYQIANSTDAVSYTHLDVYKRQGFYSCLQNNLCCLNGTFLCAGMRTDDDCITCFQCDQSFED